MALMVSNALINLKMKDGWRNMFQKERKKENITLVYLVACHEYLQWHNNVNDKYGFN